VAFDSDFTETLLDKSLGLKYVKGNGTATFLTKHTLEGAQPSLIKGPLWKVGVCTLGVLLIVMTW